MHFNVREGSSHLMVIILMIVVISVASFGFIIMVNNMDKNTAIVANDSTNLSGIVTNGEMYNATNSTVHGLVTVMPNFIWIVIAFFFVLFLTLLYAVVGRR